MQETYRKTEKLLKKIKRQSERVSAEKPKKNYFLRISRQEIEPNSLYSDNIRSANINNESNTVNVTLQENFVLAVLTDIYKADFKDIKKKLKTKQEQIVLDKMAIAEIKFNAMPFLNSLKV